LGAPDASIVRARGSRWLHFVTSEGLRWFVNGERLSSSRRGGSVLRELAAGRPVQVSKLGTAAPLLEDLLRLGGVEVKRASKTRGSKTPASATPASTQQVSAARPARRTGASRRTR
ncbi:MAG: hypothetical protein ABW217_11380, partial [Polyangiaceae bacterium]